MSGTKLTLSVEEMAHELGISKPIAYELVKKEGFPAIRISERRIVIPVTALQAWLSTKAVEGGSV